MPESRIDESCTTLGSVAIIQATTPGNGFLKHIAPLFGIIFLVFLQMTLMGTFYLAASRTPCEDHAQCSLGEFCSCQ